MATRRITIVRALMLGGVFVVLALAGVRELLPTASSTNELTAMCVNKSSSRVRYVSSTTQCSTKTETPKSLPANAPLYLCAYPPDGFTRSVSGPGQCVSGETPLTLPDTGPTWFCVDSATGSFLQYTTNPPSCTAMLAVVSVPVAGPDVYPVLEDGSLNPAAPGVLGNDSDAMSNPLTAALVPASGPAHASAFALSGNGAFTYTPDPNYCGNDGFSYTATDGTYTSQPATVTINVTCVNDAPVLANVEGTALSYTANSPAAVVSPGITVADVDSPNLAGATVKITTGYQNGQDVLALTSPPAGITPSFNAATGVLSLTGSATVADYQTALRGVTYQDPAGSPTAGIRTVTFQVDDGAAANNLSNVVSRDVTVTLANQAPVLANIEGTALGYTENGPPAAVTSSITVADADSANLTAATVSITGNFASGQDVLSFANQLGITGSYNSGTGVLTLSGTTTVANYQTALRAVQYSNTSDNPSTATRTVSFQVNDGAASNNLSNVVTRDIAITSVNDAPVLAGIEGTALSYTENDPPTVVTSTITVTDADSPNLASAVVSISPYLNGQDVLALPSPPAGITATFDASAGVLTLTGSASVADYQAALRGVTYVNTSDNPGTATRSVVFTVDDGAATNHVSLLASRNISVTSVNDPPVLANIEAGALTYTENDAATSITSTLTVSDADNANLTGATVAINTGYVNGQDVLSFTNQLGITGTFTPATGVLFLSGPSSVANYQTALRAVKYTNTSDNPSTATRTVTFHVDDGSPSGPSSSATRDITVVSVNDAPVLANIEGTALPYAPNDPATVVSPGVTAADADSPNLAGGTVSITTGYQNGQDVLALPSPPAGITPSFNAATGVLTLTGPASVTDYQTALRGVTYQDTAGSPTAGTRTVSFQVDDGAAANNLSNVVSRNIAVTGVNSAPVLGGIEGSALTYTENAPATVVSPGITVTDADSANLTGATVSITTNFAGGQDVLGFVNQLGITGSYNATTGVLTLSGTTTVANYQTALRAVTYANTSDNPATATRTVSFQVDDGGAVNNLSNTVIRDVAVTAVNDAPVLGGIESSALTYTENGPATAVTSTLTVADADSPNLAGATVSVTTGYQNGQDVLALASPPAGITPSFDAATGTLTLSGSAPLADYQAALRAVTYANTSDNPSTATRTVSFQVDDGAAANNLSNVATRNIALTAVNDAPVLANTEGTALTYTENDPATIVSPGITAADVDSPNLTGATASISTNFASGQDVLSFANQLGITGSYNTGTGVLTLSGTTTVANYQTALRAVKYANTSDNPSTATRTVSFQVNDGAAANNLSNVATRDITVVAVNDAPVLAGIEGSALAYTENAPATAVTSTLTVTDADSTNLTGATVSISTNFASGQDVLSFANQLGITGSYNSGTGVLTLSGTTTVANYQTALRAVQYSNTSDNPSTATRTVSFQVNDGGAVNNLSNTVTRNITVVAVNDAPVLANTEGTALTYTENDPATIVSPGITAADVDSTNLTGATVSISTNFASGQDVLSFANQLGITGSYNTGTGVLTLSGTTTVANYQTALRAVQYANTSDNPSTATRTVSFQVNDGGAVNNLSNTVTRNITVVAVNDAPVLAGIEGSALTYTENDPATIVSPGITAADVDSTNLTGATVSVTTNFAGSQDVLSFANQLGITGSYNTGTGVLTLSGTTTVANYQTALRAVKYTNTSDNPSALTRTVSFQVNDGGAVNDLSNTVTRNITVIPVNDAPLAVDKAHTVTGNVQISVPTGSGLLSGVTDPEGDAMTASVDASNASTGNVVINADGSYTYNPKAGYEGNDTVKFKVCDNGTPLPACSPAKNLTLTISNMIWFVDNSKVAAGDGRLTAPFNTLAGFQAVNDGTGDHPAVNDNIFIDRTTATDYTGPVTLLNGQKLFGKGATAPLAGASSLTGITLAPDSIALPTTSGTAPKIVTTAASTNAVNLNGAGGTNTIRGIAIGNTTGAGISGSGFGTLTSTETAIGPSRTGAALNLSGGTANVTFSDVSSSSSASAVTLGNIDGTLTFSAGSISGYTSNGFLIQTAGGSADVSYAGTIGNGTGTAVNISGKDAGTVTFSGAVSQSGGGAGVSLSSNTNTNVKFNGGVIVSSGANAAFSASNTSLSGTVEVTGSNNTLTTTTGTALSVTNMNISLLGLTFKSISAGTTTSGPANGIALNNTGTTNGLTVSGDGGPSNNGSGGVVQHTTGIGISLTSTANVHLNYMNVQNSSHGGIKGISVSGFTLNRSNVTTNGTTTSDEGLQFGEFSGTTVGVTGTVSITNSSISGNAHNNVHFRDTSGTISSLTVTGSSFNDVNDTTGANSFLFEGSGTSVLTSATISGSTFQNNSPQRALEVQGHDTASVGTFTVQNNTFNDNGIHASFTQDTAANVTFKFLNNGTLAAPMITSTIQAVNVFSSATSTGGTIVGTMQNNFIGNPAVAGSGSTGGQGIEVVIQGRTQATLKIDSNTIRQVGHTEGAAGIQADFRGPTATGQPITQSDITITNNTVQTDAPNSTFPLGAIEMRADNQGSPARVRANITGNTVPSTGSYDYPSFDGHGAQLVYVNLVPATAQAQLVDNAPASPSAQQELNSHNTGSVFADSNVTLIAGPISTPP